MLVPGIWLFLHFLATLKADNAPFLEAVFCLDILQSSFAEFPFSSHANFKDSDFSSLTSRAPLPEQLLPVHTGLNCLHFDEPQFCISSPVLYPSRAGGSSNLGAALANQESNTGPLTGQPASLAQGSKCW